MTQSQAGGGIRLRGRFSHGDQPLFDDLDLALEGGQWTCLLGPSGVGKSTILRVIAGLDTGGVFDGSIDPDDGAPLHGRFAYMAQSDLLLPWLDVRGNVMLGASLRGQDRTPDRADQLLKRVELEQHAAKRPHELSGGMRQRVALARTLMEDRPLLLLDEPFSALDARTRSEVQELAFEMLAGRTVLLVTHDPAEAARVGHRIYLMTESGLERAPTGEQKPLRGFDDPETLSIQSRLFARLRQR